MVICPVCEKPVSLETGTNVEFVEGESVVKRTVHFDCLKEEEDDIDDLELPLAARKMWA